jgi:hypothetical protein
MLKESLKKREEKLPRMTQYLNASSPSKDTLFVNSPGKAFCISPTYSISEKYILVLLCNFHDPPRERD